VNKSMMNAGWWRCLFVSWLLLLGPRWAQNPPVAGVDPEWFLVPNDDLGAFEALEYAILRINEMREHCDGFHLAPLQQANYNATEVFVKNIGLCFVYRVHIRAINELAPAEIVVDIAREISVTDLSLFQVIDVVPMPCDLFSELDDAELMVSTQSKMAKRAKNAAMEIMNAERQVLCPQRPQLQFIRVMAASVQPAEGRVVRLVLELREASKSFQTSSFQDIVTVVYALDPNVPSECTLSPEVYPARRPCQMKYTEEQENFNGAQQDDQEEAEPEEEPVRRRLRGESMLRALEQGNAWTAKTTSKLKDISRSAPVGRYGKPMTLPELRQRRGRRRLQSELPGNESAPAPRRRLENGASAGDWALIRPFVDQKKEVPSEYDPRLRTTLCFPRGFTRKQGSCGSSWAFAATAVASFRKCLHDMHQGNANAGIQFLSAQELISAKPSMGCSGGSASYAFYQMKDAGVAYESCSRYRMRCFMDNSMIAVGAADAETSTPKSEHFESSDAACPPKPDPKLALCKCLPNVFHLTKPVEKELLPSSCPKVTVPHYFKIAGTAEGNTIPAMEMHMKQEILLSGPLYVSMLLYEDFFDPVSWTESGIYVHKRGVLVGKHAAITCGWGTDAEGRDYWLLLNSWGHHWQQEGYFKVMRGDVLEIPKFGAWSVDWSHPDVDSSKPVVSEVEVDFSPVVSNVDMATPIKTLKNVWLRVSSRTDEPARVLVRVQGLRSTVTGEHKDKPFQFHHVLMIDLLRINLLGERAKVQLWAVDKAQNTQSWGPFTFDIPTMQEFQASQARRLGARRLVFASEGGNSSALLI